MIEDLVSVYFINIGMSNRLHLKENGNWYEEFCGKFVLIRDIKEWLRNEDIQSRDYRILIEELGDSLVSYYNEASKK